MTAITKTNGAEVWAGAILALDGGIDWSVGTTIKMVVWSPRVGTPILLKIEGGPPDQNGNPSDFAEVSVSTTQANMWETLYFDMTGANGGFNASNSYDRFIVFPDFGESGRGETFYIDNIEVTADGGGGGNSAPITAAPTPQENDADVISIFSDSYTDTAVDTYRADWSDGGSLETIVINGNNVLKYVGLNFVGIETVQSQVNASEMTHIHLDVWTADATQFRVKIVDFGADGGYQGGDDTEHEIAYDNPTQGSWISYDIPLSDFTGLVNTSNLAQYVLSAEPANQATIYVDNIYLYK